MLGDDCLVLSFTYRLGHTPTTLPAFNAGNEFEKHHRSSRFIGLLCRQITSWKETNINFAEGPIPEFVTVREADGVMVRVPIVRHFYPVSGRPPVKL